MKKSFFLILLLLLLFIETLAQNNKPLYSGGMLFFQPGYTFIKNPYQNVKSVGFGLGGILRFYPFEHLCVGVSGGSQKTKYKTLGSDNSYVTLGYGGLILGYTLATNKFRFCASLGVARGKLRNLHISGQNGAIIENAFFYSYGTWVAYPLLSFDYMLTKKISLISQFTALSAVYNKNDLYFCPVFQLGILFNR